MPEYLLAVQGKVAAGEIQRGKQEIRRAGRLREVDDLAHIVRVHAGSGQQKRALRQAAAGLVHTDGGHVRARLHGGDRQRLGKRKVRAVRLVGKSEHSVLVRQARDGADIGANAVIRRVIDENRLRVRVFAHGALHLADGHPQRNAQAAVHLGVYIHRHRAAEHQSIDRAAVDITGQDDLIPAAAGIQNHALHGGGCAADHEESVRRAEGVRGDFLRFADDGNGMAEVIQRFHGVHVRFHAALAQKGRQFRIAAPALVPRHVKRHHAHPPEILQRLVNRCARLFFPVHSVRPSPCKLCAAKTQ